MAKKNTGSLLKQLVSLPISLVKVFTWDKSFKNNPFIGSRLLNRLGLHVFRLVVSHLLFNFRLMLLSPLANAEQRQHLKKFGYLKIENFLPEAQFQQLKSEIQHYNGSIRQEIEGSTLTQRLYLTEDVLDTLPECQRFCTDKPTLKLLRYASSKNRIPFFHLENIVHHASQSKRPDPQKDFHTDTFHPCIKAWHYIDDVDDHNGPFIFVPGSHRLTWNRIKWEYRQSLIASGNKSDRPEDRYWDGSFRVKAADLEALGYGQPVAMRVPANTLLIANVHGVHRRGDADPKATRMTVWMQARDNPFNPVFSPFPTLTARIFEFFWARHMTQKTRQKTKSGKWQAINGGFTRFSSNS
jgi:hypothetical protein